ncbi:hypothetical protein [Streptomyces sp. NBC_00893]|uniref:hypothetical protein n=1 Tax=Streptomyces sp. NBC_00893 TaxID=2975862 RepID=UPI0022569F4A|nr:hypothetical protein [Streptomyces sp. NBC_00893]MCX4850528.1 hypothetical protein [Streptomyces sp. NBC_00893]
MSATQTSSRARTYALYTGAPCQAACDAVTALQPHAPIIPEPAHQAQLLLESEVFYRVLNSQRHFFEYPFGIRYVQPTPHSTRLHLESNVSLESLLSGLLPVRSPMCTGRDQIYGLNGVRICARTDRGIELRRLGQSTSIQLTGPSRRAFQKAEAALAQQIRSNGGEP